MSGGVGLKGPGGSIFLSKSCVLETVVKNVDSTVRGDEPEVASPWTPEFCTLLFSGARLTDGNDGTTPLRELLLTVRLGSGETREIGDLSCALTGAEGSVFKARPEGHCRAETKREAPSLQDSEKSVLMQAIEKGT